ncbi:MAG: Hsp20/alpha crystallin family protein [Pseudomonadales bacterium]|jgi:HSP20 family molecular chaperone IbpA|nr:Hsp20/alpha crystallin family protein [Pseudomonadales bacterium]
MSNSKAVKETPAAHPATAPGSALRPRVEVFEDAEGITLIADLPGVSSERLNVQVDKDTLQIEGSADIAMPEGMQALHAEIRSKLYRRSFSLSSELDPDAIAAKLKDGVLTLHIPKRAEVRPRKVEVKVA